jgi:hypothetical protein
VFIKQKKAAAAIGDLGRFETTETVSHWGLPLMAASRSGDRPDERR